MPTRHYRPYEIGITGIHADAGRRIGKGQDNAVYELRLPPAAEKLAALGDWVVKLSHKEHVQTRKSQNRSTNPTEAAILGTLYKRNKYDILKHFLGDHIPESMFLPTTILEGSFERPAEVTIQKRLPQFTLNMLTPEQQQDPRLHGNVQDLLKRLAYMYSVIGEANGRSHSSVNLDAKLDLGGISDFVKSDSLDRRFTVRDIDKTIHKIDSPNVLVDPESMQVYCIDFDQGEWAQGMDEAKALAFSIDAQRKAHATQTYQVAN
jgi:hypothetical protein